MGRLNRHHHHQRADEAREGIRAYLKHNSPSSIPRLSHQQNPSTPDADMDSRACPKAAKRYLASQPRNSSRRETPSRVERKTRDSVVGMSIEQGEGRGRETYHGELG